MSDVFISYSRLDKDFVGQLREALLAKAQDVWIDWESIPPSQAWWNEIQKGIARANNFVVVMSPDSMGSPICQMEIEYARQLKKRIIPVIYAEFEREDCLLRITRRLAKKEESTTREIWGTRQPHDVYDANDAELKHINYFFFNAQADFTTRFDELFAIISTDYEHKEQHTTLELRALEWNRRGRDASFLLIENELLEAQAWLGRSAGKEPIPTELHRAYIEASVQRTRQLRNIRRASIIGSVVAVVAIVAAVGAFVAGTNAVNDARAQLSTATVQQGMAQESAFEASTQVADASIQLSAVPPTLEAIATQIQVGEDRIESLRLAAVANDVLQQENGNPEVAALLGIRALKIGNSGAAYEALTDATDHLYSLARFEGHYNVEADQRYSAPVRGAIELHDGRLLSWGDDQTLRLWNTNGGLIKAMEGHTDRVNGVLELHDGRLLSWSDDHTLRLWSVTGEFIKQLDGHTDEVHGALELRDGGLLSWGDDRSLRLWSVEGEFITQLAGHEKTVTGALQLSDDHILSWSDDLTLRLWNSDGTLLRLLDDHFYNIAGALQLTDGRILLWGAVDDYGSLVLWSENNDPFRVFRGQTGDIDHVIELSNGRFLSWSGYTGDNTLSLWSSEGEVVAVLSEHTYYINGAAEMPDGRLLSWSEDRTLKLWSQDGAPLATMSGHNSGLAGALVLKDGNILSWGSGVVECDGECSVFDYWLRLWDTNGNFITTLAGHQFRVFGAMQLHDGRLFSWSEDGTLRLWSEGTTNTKIEVYKNNPNVSELDKNNVYSVRQLSDGHLLSLGSCDYLNSFCDYRPRLWTSSGEAQKILEGFTERVGGILELGDGRLLLSSRDAPFSTEWTWNLWSSTGDSLPTISNLLGEGVIELHDGKLLTWGSVNNDSMLRLLDKDGTSLFFVNEHSFSIEHPMELSDGRLLWSVSNVLRLWDINQNTIATLRGHERSVEGTLQLHDGRILSWSDDDTLRLWSPDGTVLSTLKSDEMRSVTGAMELKDDRLLSWGGSNLWLWKSSGELITTISGHTGKIGGVLELNDGRLLSWSIDQTLRLWSSSGEPLAVLRGHPGNVVGALELHDGRLLSWAGCLRYDECDNSLRLWSADGEALTTLRGHTDRINGAQELADGRLISWSRDGTMRLWYVNPQEFITYACMRVFRDLTDAERELYGITDTAPTCTHFGPAASGA